MLSNKFDQRQQSASKPANHKPIIIVVSCHVAQFEQDVHTYTYMAEHVVQCQQHIPPFWQHSEALVVELVSLNSDEMKRELLKDATRCVTIHIEAQKVLPRFERAFSKEGIVNKLEGIQ